MRSVCPAQPQQKFPQILSAQEVQTEKFLWQITRDGCLRKIRRGPKMAIEDVFSDNKIPLSSVFFLDDAVGWVGSQNGFILQTQDGGNKWRLFGDGDKSDLIRNRVSINCLFFGKFKEKIFGWATADKGLLFHFTDGPHPHWHLHLQSQKLKGLITALNVGGSPHFTQNLVRINFANIKEGLLADAAGNLFFTSTAGALWQKFDWEKFEGRLKRKKLIDQKSDWPKSKKK